MHNFHNFSSASGGFTPQTLTGAPPQDSSGDFRLKTPNLPTTGKILRVPMNDATTGLQLHSYNSVFQ